MQGVGGLRDVESAPGDLGEVAELLELHITDFAYYTNTRVFAVIRAHRSIARLCTSTTRSISGWWMSGSRNSATRHAVAWQGSWRRTNCAPSGCVTACIS